MDAHSFQFSSAVGSEEHHNGFQFVDLASDYYSPEDLDYYSMLPEDFAPVPPGGVDSWIMEHLGQTGADSIKSTGGTDGLQQILQNRPETGFLNDIWDLSRTHRQRSFSENHGLLLGPLDGHDLSDEQPLPSQQAAERALFMTPSFSIASFSTFSASPVSDLCGTPEMSYTSSRWDAEHNRGDMLSPHASPTHTHSSDYGFFQHNIEEDNCMTTLEMPDGTTRLSSNWLPVDSTAGFTIESEFPRTHQGRDTLEIDSVQNMPQGFFSNQFDSTFT